MNSTTINFVWTWASLLSGTSLNTCITYDDPSCEGGLAAVRANLRYYEEKWRQEQRELTGEDPEQSSLVIPRLDYQSAFAQMHELDWAVNRVIFQNHFGWEAYFAYPSLITQDNVRDLSQLQTLDLKPLMTNVQIPTSNSWSPYIENIHFDAKTGLAVLAFDTPDQKYVTANIASAKALLSYVAARNDALPGCSKRKKPEGYITYEGFLQSKGLNATSSEQTVKPPHCWIPLVIYEETKPNGFEDFVEAMRNHTDPPSVIVDVRGNNATPTDDPYVFLPTKFYHPSNVVEDTGIWVLSYMFYYLIYAQQRLIVSTDPDSRGRVLDVGMIEERMFTIPDEIKDDEFRADFNFIRSLAEQANDNNPVAGRSEFMPAGENEKINSRPCMGGECPIGNLFADAIRWKMNSDISFIQSGGVRGPGWPSGNVSYSHIWEALPFPNTLCTGNATGLSLWRVLNHSTARAAFESTYTTNGDRLLQVSGMRYTYNTELPSSGRLVGMEVFNRTTGRYEPMERLRLYKFTTTSWMCGGFDDFPILLGEEFLSINGKIPDHVDGGGSELKEDAGRIEAAGIIQEDVFKFLESLDSPYNTSIQGRLNNDTSIQKPIDWAQSEDSCDLGTYWVQNLLTCFSCPNTADVTFAEERIEFGEAYTGSPATLSGTAKVSNRGDTEIDIEVKSNPDWIDFVAVRRFDEMGGELQDDDLSYLVKSEQQISIKPGGSVVMDLTARATSLEAGSALGAVSFAVLYGSGKYNGCVGRDATFETFMEVARVPQLNTPGSVKAVGLTLMVVSMLVAALFAFWTYRKREHSIIKAMQPVFMIAICAGSFIIACAICPLTIADELVSAEEALAGYAINNRACMATPWLLSMGFSVVLGSLAAKLWRINKIFHGARLRQTVTAKEALVHASILFTLNFVILLAWQIKSPLKYEVRSGDEEWDLYGNCTATDTAGMVFAGLTLALNVCALLLTCHQAWKACKISSDFSESKHLGMALFSWVELMLVGLPVLFLIQNDNANAQYFLQISLIFAITMTMLLIIFLPLVFQVRDYDKADSGELRRANSVRISGLHHQGGSTSSFLTNQVSSGASYSNGLNCTDSPNRSKDFTLSTGNGSQRQRKEFVSSLSEKGSLNRSAEFSVSLDEKETKKLEQISESLDEEIAREISQQLRDEEAQSAQTEDDEEANIYSQSSKDPSVTKESSTNTTEEPNIRVVRLGDY